MIQFLSGTVDLGPRQMVRWWDFGPFLGLTGKDIMGRFLLLVALSATFLGCESRSPFADEVDEFRYLKSLSNPTPEQWRRKKDLAPTAGVQAREQEQDEMQKGRQ
jgi:hypothetical protein